MKKFINRPECVHWYTRVKRPTQMPLKPTLSVELLWSAIVADAGKLMSDGP